MNKRDLEFLHIYAEVENLGNCPVSLVIELTKDFSDELKDRYIEAYNGMLEYNLQYEVELTRHLCNCSFLDACADWDI